MVLIMFVLAAQTSSSLQGVGPHCGAGYTGSKAQMMQSGVDMAVQIMLPVIIQEVERTPVQDVVIPTDVPIIGTIVFTISNTIVQSLQVSGATVNLIADPYPGFAVLVPHMDVSLTFNWDWKQQNWPHLSGAGTGYASCQGASMTTILNTTVDNAGKPMFVDYMVDTTLTQFDIHLNGGPDAWIFNLVQSIFNGQLRAPVQNAINIAGKQAINQAAQKTLGPVNYILPVTKDSSVDLSICSTHFTSTWLQFTAKAEFFDSTTWSEAPFKPSTPLPDPNPKGRMVQGVLSDFFFNSGIWVFFSRGQLQYQLTPENLPADSPIKLNTFYFKDAIPPLFQVFPNFFMQTNLKITKMPALQLSRTGINGTIVGTLTVQVREKNGTNTTAFVLDFEADCSAILDVTQPKTLPYVTSMIKLLDFDTILESTNIGPFPLEPAKNVIGALLDVGMIRWINQYLAVGFPIPVPEGVILTNPTVYYFDGYVELGSEMIYNPPV